MKILSTLKHRKPLARQLRFTMGARLGRTTISMLGTALLVFGAGQSTVLAASCAIGISQPGCEAIYGGWADFVRDTGCAVPSSLLADGTNDTQLDLTANQIAIAKTIIGVAKTNFPGGDEARRPALIGMMTALAESHLKIYANSGIPLSLNHPDKQATGSDHDSLGVFQQRISTNWSTISTDPNNREAVYQLMDPAYNAEAFFGTPPGANVPSALKKGLQNKEGWQDMEPWIAAQKVQVSAFDDGSNYRAQLETAQAIVDKYYAESPPVPLPVPFTGEGVGSSNTSACANGDIVLTAIALSWPEPGHPKCKLDATQAYQQALPIAQGLPNLESDNSCGSPHNDIWSDCGVFVATTLRYSGADPDYPKRGTAVQGPELASNPQWQVVGELTNTAMLQPGDVLIRNYIGDDGEAHGHTWLYLGDLSQYGITTGRDMADASWHDHVPELSTMGAPNTDNPFTIYRLIAPGA